MDWLLAQAQSASPLFSVGCLIGIGVLWRQHVKDSQTIVALSQANTAATNAVVLAIEKGSSTTALAMEKLASKIHNGRR